MSKIGPSVTQFFVVSILAVVVILGQAGERVTVGRDHPAIAYSGAALRDQVSELNRKLLEGSARLSFDSSFGYLPSLLELLRVPVESQVLVFSKTSLQSAMISPENPRAIFFNDSVSIALVRGGPILELTAQDPQQGVIFYTLGQDRQNRPVLAREEVCLSCHDTTASLNAPGVLVRSVFPGATGLQVSGLTGSPADHRTPFAERWGGWYVTGKSGPSRHLANAVVNSVRNATEAPIAEMGVREKLPERFNATGYPTPYSDIVALAVFEHQMHMMNLLTRLGWETRQARYDDPDGSNRAAWQPIQEWARELVDYLLFVDEAPLTATFEGTSGFKERFAGQGPFDKQRRSLRQFDLKKRLMRYPCSYMIYSEAFDALPAQAKDAVYRRMWDVLSGHETGVKYRVLPLADRKAVVEILRETRQDLPDYFLAKAVR